MTRETRRTVIGFIGAPLVGAIAWGVLLAAIGPAPIEALLQLPTFLIFSSVIAYPAVLVLGIPAYLLYRRFGIDTLKAYMLGGFAGGMFLTAMVVGVADYHPLMDPRLAAVLFWSMAGLGGAAGAAFFWAFSVRGT